MTKTMTIALGLILLAGAADATEYEFRLLDPLPEDFLRFEGNNTTEPVMP